MLILRCQGQKRTKQDKPEQAQSTVIFIWVHLWVQIWVFKKSARPAFQGILLMGNNRPLEQTILQDIEAGRQFGLWTDRNERARKIEY